MQPYIFMERRACRWRRYEHWPSESPPPSSSLPHPFKQPTGLVSVTGLAAQGLYARGFLERWSIKPAFFAREVGTLGVYTGCIRADS